MSDAFEHVYEEIDALIKQKKGYVKRAINDTMVSLWF